MRRLSSVCSSHHFLVSFSVPQTLLVDGYISQTFRSRTAEQYILGLLKSNSVPPYIPSSFPAREGNFFLIHSVPSHIPAQHSSPPGRWLVDRGVVNRGTVVPQTMFSTHTAFDKRQQGDLQLPIFFEGSDGRLGISLEASAAGQCYALREASYPTQLGEKTTTNIRIAVSASSGQPLAHLLIWLLSGLGIKSSSAPSKLATRRARTIPSTSPCSPIKLGAL